MNNENSRDSENTSEPNKYLEHIKLLRDALAKVNGYRDAAEMDDYFDFEDMDDELMKQADSANKIDVCLDDY